MKAWLQLTPAQRKASIDQASEISGIRAIAIEKDWWVTLALEALFATPYAQYIVFKGGTSLSKCWKLVARFSEDIDIALSPESFGMKYVANPTKGQVEKLKKKGCLFTSKELKAAIEEQLVAMSIPAGMVMVTAAPIPTNFPDTDPQTLFLAYPSLYDANAYIIDSVKIEVSVRSMLTPYTTMPVQSMLSEINPNPAYTSNPFTVTVVEPRKTLLEKTFLLHEEFRKPDKTKIRSERMSRHLYDLGKMMATPIVEEALQDHALYDNLVLHREWYSRISWVDYATHGHNTLSFLPPPELLALYRADYATMQEEMIYEEAMPFDELVNQLKILRARFRLKFAHANLDDIIVKAKENIKNEGLLIPGGDRYEIFVHYLSDINFPDGPYNETISYKVTMVPYRDELVLEDIAVMPG